jgi:hypothetical protein
VFFSLFSGFRSISHFIITCMFLLWLIKFILTSVNSNILVSISRMLILKIGASSVQYLTSYTTYNHLQSKQKNIQNISICCWYWVYHVKIKKINTQAFVWIKSCHVHIRPDTWYCSVGNLGNFDTLDDRPQIKMSI